ncbi:type II secretion system protein [Acinetobacter dispersus]|uniref:type II secretion system protein n=1 Tax=Acinetobacter dispersus TaxID=70348 RepID=UPI001D181459|nr:type II secretion system protein [Acinetobacter dispersus]
MKNEIDNLLKHQSGAVYVWMLVSLIFLSLGLGQWSINYATIKQREKEQELIKVGLIYRNAIHEYYESSPGGVKNLPEKLEDLLKDPRYLDTRRYLRKLEKDPMTSLNFEIIRNTNGQIIGVHSISDKKTLKKRGFPIELKKFEQAKSYKEWFFTI